MKLSFWTSLFIPFIVFYSISIFSIQKTTPDQKESLSRVLHIVPHQLDEMEDTAYANFVDRSFKRAESEGYDLVVVEIDTPGGELAATQRIKNIILSSSVKSICFINKNAISAGSLIALSCGKLYMADGSVIGAATPVFINGQSMEKAPEKVVSAARASWRSAAEAHKKNPEIAEAFVDDSIVLTREKHGINKPAGKLLTLTASEMVDLKMVDGMANNVGEILKAESVLLYKVDKSEPEFVDNLIAFFLNPVISGILIGLGGLALLYELKVPGWGISGAIGVLFLSIYFITRIIAGYSGWGAPALFGFGLFLLLLEIFVIPGFGIAGVMAMIAIMGSILWSYGMNNLQEGVWVLAIATLVSGSGLVIIVKSLPEIMKRNKNIFLSEVLRSDKEELEFYTLLPGKRGVSLSTLRPSGMVLIDDKKLDALSDGEFIENNQSIVVSRVEGTKVIVKRG